MRAQLEISLAVEWAGVDNAVNIAAARSAGGPA
jgi:hypothetical protein